MKLQIGSTYRAKEVLLSLKILELLPSGQVSVEYTRNGFSQVVQYDPARLEKNLLNEDLYTTDQLKLF